MRGHVTAGDRVAQIVALWQARPRDGRGPVDVAFFFQWLRDYTPWLIPPGDRGLKELTTMLGPYASRE